MIHGHMNNLWKSIDQHLNCYMGLTMSCLIVLQLFSMTAIPVGSMGLTEQELQK